jgi:methyl-accepting chemotaxis protein
MNNWTIGKRLTLGFGILLLITLFLGVATWVKMNSISTSLTELTGESLPELTLAGNIRYQAAMLRITNFKHVVYTDMAKKTELDGVAAADEKDLSDMVAKYESFVNRDDKRVAYAKVTAALQAYTDAGHRLRDASKEGKADEIQAQLLNAGKVGNDFIASVDTLRELAAKDSQESAKTIATTVTSSKATMIVMVCVAVFLTVAIAWLITRGISHVLTRIVTELSAGADQTTAAAGQVSASSQSLAEGASEQAASLEETSASLEEMSSMTKRNADNAANAKDIAAGTRQAADTGASDMEEMTTAMNAIKTSSDGISKIIKTIDEIAFQTNLLALNAAVEAARAGEAGMGFAVVADEVRNLAQRSAQAAKETAAKIEDSIQKSANGVQISTKVAERLQEIVTKARQVDELVAEIATASKEQSQGIGQVNTAVSQMDKVTQSNAASAEESASAAEELNAQALTLKGVVADLQRLVGGRNGSSAPASPAAKQQKIAVKSVIKPTVVRASSHSEPKATASTSARDTQPAAAVTIPMEGDFKDF